MLTYDHIALLDTARADLERDLARRARLRAARRALAAPVAPGRRAPGSVPARRRLVAFLRHAL